MKTLAKQIKALPKTQDNDHEGTVILQGHGEVHITCSEGSPEEAAKLITKALAIESDIRSEMSKELSIFCDINESTANADASKLKLEAINVIPDCGTVELFYGHDEVATGHSVIVELEDGEVTGVSIEG